MFPVVMTFSVAVTALSAVLYTDRDVLPTVLISACGYCD